MSEAAQPTLRTYIIVYALLMAGLVATVGVAYVPLGRANLLVALTIGFAKAALVVLFFMHVLYSPKLTWIGIFAGLVWFAILLSLVAADYVSRDWLPVSPAQTELAQPPEEGSFNPSREASAPTEQGVPHGSR
jgi:cytochrome c oxidase subunit IV